MLLLAGLIGAISGWAGSSISALTPRMPAGAVIVLVVALVFVLSMLFGSARGLTVRHAAQRRLQRKVGRQNLLRAVYELLELNGRARGLGQPVNEPVLFGDVLAKRSWTARRLRRLIARARRNELVERFDGGRLCLSEAGFGEAARTTRNHLLWEEYLVTCADVAPQHIDRDADTVEHILGPDMVRQLEEQLVQRGHAFVRLISRHLGPAERPAS
jgi:manganese/zinc/iron transport system permease protein